jgi:nucleotide-binding universal stress UspA family protein
MLLHAVPLSHNGRSAEVLSDSGSQLDSFLKDEFKCFTTHRICIEGDPAPAIAETVQSWNPGLVMMPTHGLGYFRRHLLGSVTAKALHDLHCPIWTSIHAETAPPLAEIHFHHILCAIDLSERSPCILRWASQLASELGAALAVVYASMAVDPAADGWALGEDFLKFASDQAKNRIALLQKQIGTGARVFVAAGHPADVITAAARKFEADLLVLGRHEQAGVTGALFQNAYAILRESPCPTVSI